MRQEKNNLKLKLMFQVGAIAGSIPVTLISGPVAGYFLGKFIQEKFFLPDWIIVVLVFFGLAVSIFETACLIKVLLKMTSKNNYNNK